MSIPVSEGLVTGELALPDGKGPWPAILIAHELNGYRPSMANAARRLAEAGFAALAVDLYAPLGGAPRMREQEEIAAWLQRLHDPTQIADLGDCLDALAGMPEIDRDKLGLLGYSAGGRYAGILAADRPEVRVLVTFYARPWPGAIANHMLGSAERVPDLHCDVLGIFAAQDYMIPEEMAHQYDALLAEHGIPHEVYVFEGCDHFFANESFAKYYRPEQAEAAWVRALDFLDRRLRRN